MTSWVIETPPRYPRVVKVAEYGAAAVEGFKSILLAVREWRDNPLRSQVNRRMWGRWWPATLLVAIVAALALEAVRPLTVVIGLVPPLQYLMFIPAVVRDLLVSAPALFGFVVAWRVHRLRSTDRGAWTNRTGTPGFGGSMFDAGAAPVAVSAVVLAIGWLAVEALRSAQRASEGAASLVPSTAELPAIDGFGWIARVVLTVALTAGILGIHRSVGTGLKKLIGAGFFVWGMRLAIGFTVPWMTLWWAGVPFIGRFVAEGSTALVLALFDLVVACAAWTAARERFRAAPFWSDPPPPPPPPPPTDDAPDGG